MLVTEEIDRVLQTEGLVSKATRQLTDAMDAPHIRACVAERLAPNPSEPWASITDEVAVAAADLGDVSTAVREALQRAVGH